MNFLSVVDYSPSFGAAWLLSQNVLVKALIIVVIEIHNSSHEGVVDVWRYNFASLIIVVNRYHN